MLRSFPQQKQKAAHSDLNWNKIEPLKFTVFYVCIVGLCFWNSQNSCWQL